MLSHRPAFRLARFSAILLCGALAFAARARSPTPAVRSWEITGNVRTAFGYRENLLLSAVRDDDSAFARAEAELFWLSLPTERFEAHAFINSTLTRYLASAENPRDSQSFAHVEGRWFATPAVQATGTLEGYRLEQVFDLSASDALRPPTRLTVNGATVTVAGRWQFLPRTWFEFKPALQVERYDDRSDDNYQRTAQAALGRSWRDGRVEIILSAQALRRVYDERPRRTSAGRPLLGTELVYVQREGEARATVVWDAARRWRTATVLALTANRDNGSGYFDCRRRSARQEISWTLSPWKFRLTGRAGRYDYGVQLQGIGINPPTRLKEDFLVELRAEHRLTPRMSLFADVAWERSRSNDPLANYRGRTFASGLDWSF